MNRHLLYTFYCRACENAVGRMVVMSFIFISFLFLKVLVVRHK